MTNMSPSPSPPPWDECCQAAVHEPDLEKLLERIHAAEAALYQRWQELAVAEICEPELRRMHEATEMLLKLKTEELKWPAFGGTNPLVRPDSAPRGPLNYSPATTERRSKYWMAHG